MDVITNDRGRRGELNPAPRSGRAGSEVRPGDHPGGGGLSVPGFDNAHLDTEFKDFAGNEARETYGL